MESWGCCHKNIRGTCGSDKGAFAQSPVETAIVTALGFIKLSTLTTKSMEKAATKILKVLGISLEKMRQH